MSYEDFGPAPDNRGNDRERTTALQSAQSGQWPMDKEQQQPNQRPSNQDNQGHQRPQGNQNENYDKPQSQNNGNGQAQHGGGGYGNGGGYDNNRGNSFPSGGGYNSGGGGNNNRPPWNNGGGYSGGGGGGGYQRNSFQKGGFSRKEPEDENDTALYKPYIGTGNTGAPPDVIAQIKRLAKELEGLGYTVRSGGFDGPEEAFEKATTKNEIHLPWKGFNEKESKFTFTSKRAHAIAKRWHPTYDGLKPAIQTFYAKNVRIAMGKDLVSPAMFAIVWSEDGIEDAKDKTARSGNAGHLICVACDLRIPIFNLARPDAEKRLRHYLGIDNVQKESFSDF